MDTPYFEKYHREKTWYGKVILIEVYHIKQRETVGAWTINKTAAFFGVSVGLVSENLELGESIKKWPELLNCKTRELALKRMKELLKRKSA